VLRQKWCGFRMRLGREQLVREGLKDSASPGARHGSSCRRRPPCPPFGLAQVFQPNTAEHRAVLALWEKIALSAEQAMASVACSRSPFAIICVHVLLFTPTVTASQPIASSPLA
jgi:hypothetical protein